MLECECSSKNLIKIVYDKMEKTMDDLKVKIVKLEPMRVICINGFGEGPETQAWEKMIAWAKAKGLWDDGKPKRFFGFNNPDPSPAARTTATMCG